MSNIMNLFKTVILVQLFYAFAITLIVYATPVENHTYVTSFSDITDELSLESVGNDIEDSLEKQTNIPLIDVGALVFYSGNILIDLLLNFAFAIPQMIGLLIFGLVRIFTLDSYIIAVTQLFTSVVIIALYVLSLIQLLTGIRSGRLV